MNSAAAWGKLAAEILSGNWDGAMEELNKVKEIITDRVISYISSHLTTGLLRSNDPTLSPNLANPLVPLPLLQHRKRP